MKLTNNLRKLIIKDLISNLIKKLNILNSSNTNQINKSLITNYNNKWDYNQIIYKYNNNNLLNTIQYKHIINNYISYMLTHKIKNNNINNIVNILYKNLIILYNNNNIDIILFIFKLKYNLKLTNLTSNLLITKLITNLIETLLNNLLKNNNNNNLKFNIKLIVLTYDYLDSQIYSKSLGKFILKYLKFDNINNININNNIINNSLINKLTNNSIMNKIGQISSILNNNKLVNNSLFNKNFIINNNLLYQLIIGIDWKFKGKNSHLESNARSLRYYNTNGKLYLLNINLYNKYKLNYYSANLSKSQSFIINKNGKYNISTTLNHF